VFDLDTPLNKFVAALSTVTSLTYLAAQMTDNTDERTVLRMLSHATEDFYRKLEEARNGAKGLKIIPQCAKEALMIVEADKLLRIYDKADAAVRSIVKKINAANENTASRPDVADSAAADDDDSIGNFLHKKCDFSTKDIQSYAAGSNRSFCLATLIAVLNVGLIYLKI